MITSTDLLLLLDTYSMQGGLSALMVCCQRGQSEIARVLLNAGANPDLQESVAFHSRYFFSAHYISSIPIEYGLHSSNVCQYGRSSWYCVVTNGAWSQSTDNKHCELLTHYCTQSHESFPPAGYYSIRCGNGKWLSKCVCNYSIHDPPNYIG